MNKTHQKSGVKVPDNQGNRLRRLSTYVTCEKLESFHFPPNELSKVHMFSIYDEFGELL